MCLDNQKVLVLLRKLEYNPSYQKLKSFLQPRERHTQNDFITLSPGPVLKLAVNNQSVGCKQGVKLHRLGASTCLFVKILPIKPIMYGYILGLSFCQIVFSSKHDQDFMSPQFLFYNEGDCDLVKGMLFLNNKHYGPIAGFPLPSSRSICISNGATLSHTTDSNYNAFPFIRKHITASQLAGLQGRCSNSEAISSCSVH